MGAKRSTPVIERQDSTGLADVLSRIHALHEWGEGWNGYDALPPKPRAITRAAEWMKQLYAEVLAAKLPWIDPLVCASADGDVSFEWWFGNRKITVYVSEKSVEYVKVWGPRVLEDMDDGDLRTAEDLRN